MYRSNQAHTRRSRHRIHSWRRLREEESQCHSTLKIFNISVQLTVWDQVFADPLSVSIKSLLKTDTLGTGHSCGVGEELSNVLDGVTEEVKTRVTCVELVGLPQPGTVLKNTGKVIVVLHTSQTELGFQSSDRVCVVAEEDAVNVIDDL